MMGDSGKSETIKIPCPDCGQLSEESLGRVVHNDIISCSLCGGGCSWLDVSAPSK